MRTPHQADRVLLICGRRELGETARAKQLTDGSRRLLAYEGEGMVPVEDQESLHGR